MLAPQQRERGPSRDQRGRGLRKAAHATGAAALPEPAERSPTEPPRRPPADAGTARMRSRGTGGTDGPVRVYVRSVRRELRTGIKHHLECIRLSLSLNLRAKVLLTNNDLCNESSLQNLLNTMNALLAMKVVPVLNGNDVVAPSPQMSLDLANVMHLLCWRVELYSIICTALNYAFHAMLPLLGTTSSA